MKYWTKSWNCIYGCTKLRAGCTNCWALQMAKRMQGNGLLSGVVEGDNWTGKIQDVDRIELPYSWKGHQIVAVDWMSDIFHENVPPWVWTSTLRVARETSHTYLILTKRYNKLPLRLSPYKPPENVFIGVTISNQKDAIEAEGILRSASMWGWKTWVSFEPALEEVNWFGYEFLNGLVMGAESGKHARPMLADPRRVRDFCALNHIPFTFKQDEDSKEPTIDGNHYMQFPT